MVYNTTVERRQRCGRDVGGSRLIALLFILIRLCASESGTLCRGLYACSPLWHVAVAHKLPHNRLGPFQANSVLSLTC